MDFNNILNKYKKMSFSERDKSNRFGRLMRVYLRTCPQYANKFKKENTFDKAYQHIVNGKSTIEWIIERYQIIFHKDGGITDDPNDWSIEIGKLQYILDLLVSVIYVSDGEDSKGIAECGVLNELSLH
jgi:predicted helicase